VNDRKDPVLRKVAFILLASLVIVGASSAARQAPTLGPPTFVVGATEDHAKGQADGGAAMYDQMKANGMGVVRMSAFYDPDTPDTIVDQAALARAIPPAVSRGLRVMLSVHPERATAVTGTPDGVNKFAAYFVKLATAFPQVTDFIVGNEPNLGRFWAPTYNGDLSIAAGASYEQALAATYDALKAVNPNINVIGFGVSPRGDDRPGSARNTISPVRFIKAVGDAYRASGRSKPIMDNVATHPYPNYNTDTPDKGYVWPNAGIPNLDRLQQAFWDAFNGTAQPTFQEGTLSAKQANAPGFIKWVLDEAGWQTKTDSLPGYTGTENIKDASGRPSAIDEATQAEYHAAIVRRVACDPRVAALLMFHWVDETDRAGFQSGTVRADGSLKPAAAAMKGAIAGGCNSATSWRHTSAVVGAAINKTPKSGFLFFVTAQEEATFTVTAASKSKSAKSTKSKKLTVNGKIKAYTQTGVKIPGVNAKNAGNYSISVKFGATMNPARTTTLKK
jgi:hypothetical protein